MHRKYRSKDGDAYVYTWNRTRENSYPITTTHFYTNKVKAASYSIFKYSDMSDKEIKDAGLYEYPDIQIYDQRPILGYTATYEEEHAVRYLMVIEDQRTSSGCIFFVLITLLLKLLKNKRHTGKEEIRMSLLFV